MNKPQVYVVIRSNTEKDNKTGEPLFWAGDKGWVTIEFATKYNENDKDNTTKVKNGSTVNIKNALLDIYEFRRMDYLNSLPAINDVSTPVTVNYDKGN
jgi:hypothetical protein